MTYDLTTQAGKDALGLRLAVLKGNIGDCVRTSSAQSSLMRKCRNCPSREMDTSIPVFCPIPIDDWNVAIKMFREATLGMSTTEQDQLLIDSFDSHDGINAWWYFANKASPREIMLLTLKALETK